MALPTNQQQNVERALLGAGTLTAWPSTIYFAAFVSGVEQTTNGWARVGYVRATMFPDADPLVNASEISFPQISALTNGVDQIKIYDASSGGNLLWASNTFTPTNIASGGYARWAAGTVEGRIQ